MNFSLPNYAIRHPITTVMVAASVIGLGLIACYRMPLEFLPELEAPFIGCFIPYPGATPEQVEREIAIPAEGQFRTVPNLRRISTRSTGDGCNVNMLFETGTDMRAASAEVRDRIERLKLTIPEEIDRILIFRHSSNSIPVMAFGLFRAGDTTEFTHLIRTVIEPRLARLDGVAEVTVFSSVPEPEVLIEFDQNRLQSHNVALYQVISILQTANINLSVGELTDGETRYYVRAQDEFHRPEDLAELVVAPNGLRLKEIADVGFKTRESDFHYDIDDKGGAFILILKESEANTVDTCQNVKAEIERIKQDPLFLGAENFVFFDQSELILAALNGLIDSGELGGLFAVAILFFFLLRVRPTLVVAFAIPSSIVAALMYMFFAGMSLNLITMVSLIVAVGMLVDNAIVVIENTYRHIQLGDTIVESASKGASEVGMAITASTVTTIVVFIPVMYLEGGEMARYMKQFAVPMTVSLVASLLVAETLIPLAVSRMRARKDLPGARLLVAQWRRIAGEPKERLDHSSGSNGTSSLVWRLHPVTLIIRGYGWLLDIALRRRLAVAVLFVGVCLVSYYLPYRRVGLQEMPKLDLREVDIELKLEQNFDMAMAHHVFDQLKAVVNRERETLGVKNVFARYEPSGGVLEVHLLEPEDYAEGETRRFTTREVLNILWERMPPRMPGVEIRVFSPEAGEMGEAAQSVSVRMKGDDSETLAGFAESFKTLMAAIPNLSDVTLDTEESKQEVQLRVDDLRAEESGISPLVVARTVDVALRGNRLPYLKQAGREFPVWAQFREEDRKTRANLDNVAVMGKEGDLVPLDQLVTFGKSLSPNLIYRVDGKNVVNVSAQAAGDDLKLVRKDLESLIAVFDLPPGYTIELGDTFEELQTTLQNFGSTLVMAIILVYIVMAASFESFLLPLSILCTVPMAGIGVYWALYLTATPLDTIGLIGCILMVGVIVNNGIVIVDHINFLRIGGMSRHEAVLQAGRDRFRPVWMTALTTILGCVPLAIEPKAGSTISFASLGRAFIGGLTVGTVLTLVIVPLFYTVIEDTRDWVLAFFANVRRVRATPPDIAAGNG